MRAHAANDGEHSDTASGARVRSTLRAAFDPHLPHRNPASHRSRRTAVRALRIARGRRLPFHRVAALRDASAATTPPAQRKPS